jgi:polyhydroxybutyrate depolymerase
MIRVLGAAILLAGMGGAPASACGAGILRLGGTVEALTARGYAVVAPDGQPRDGGGLRWSFRGPSETSPRDDDAFLAEVLADAAERHGIDTTRSILAGFSNGGFLATYLACRDPDAFAAYAPVAGGFWRPHPDGCVGPVRLLHTHGWRDSTVPLEGRPLGGGQVVQGDIFEGLAVFRRANGCTWDDPDGYGTTGDFQRRRWECVEGAALELALHPGGHGIPPGWAEMMLDWFDGLPTVATR